ncbi:PDZ domain-containing protein [Silanimonas sp.]|jgi:predicted metalloprotease with PDZ domain|uniref:PDZ domain-containing protein n=1 Tax=Silanimonas sp. TaxID=1929290 RepID=UPI0022CBCADB|nr:PDZ domain-containing protein [Silanimonas sp.]MCZ8165986.1 PDZ domain-containing protein [Silanimonas sp.]
MNTTKLKHALAAALALALAGASAAQSGAPPAPADLAAKRAEMARLQDEMSELGKRMAELARDVGGPTPRIVMHRVGQPRIGLGVVLGEAVDGGTRIAAVTPGGPADKAGLKAGDVIRSAHGKTVTGPDDLLAALRGIQKGQAVNVGYLREGRSAAAAVVADELPGRGTVQWNEAPMERLVELRGLGAGRGGQDREVHIVRERMDGDGGRHGRHDGPAGIRVLTCVNGEGDCDREAMSRAFRFRGLNLSSIDADLGRYFGADKGALLISASAALPGLKSGDVITAVEGRAVESPRDVMRALGAKESGEKLKLRILRNRAAQDVEITVPEGRPIDFLPPPPPAPPAPPSPPAPPNGAPPPPPAPPAPPAGAGLTMA